MVIKTDSTAATGWPVFWHKGKQPPWWARLLEGLYCLVIAVKRLAYRLGWAKTTHLPVPVILVGNRVVGGTGKTPLLLVLVPILQAQGWRVGIVSRGYGRSDIKIRAVDADSTSELVGDEPLLLWQALQVPVWVGSNRVAAAQALLRNQTVDVIVSDDGWQHWALGRDYVIEVVDASKAYGNGHCLPAGPLREAQNALPLPDLTLYNGREFSLTPVAWQNVFSQQRIALSELSGEVVAMAGIGHPQRFFDTLEHLGLQLKGKQAWADHQSLTLAMIQAFDEGKMPLVMTMKDAVRCQGFAQPHWWALVVETDLDASLLHPMLERITQLMSEKESNG
jgi:tetraacyldisaccharide 4'-kinase